ncbi:MarR family transcriptional regulator [Methanobrevibacter sp.]|uniref:MarR family transcriptional regulator n=1 Tax=Methanobrevibacter sp. TaxID=66852 RepID=UPI00388F1808
MEENEIFYLLGYIKVSPTRTKTLKAVKTMKMPSEIARENDLRETQVSNALSGLKSKKLAVCLNEQATKGRLYKITPLGLEVLKYLE